MQPDVPIKDPVLVTSLKAPSLRLLARWDAYLAGRGCLSPTVGEVASFGSINQLEKLQTALAHARPAEAGPIRLALKAKRSAAWREKHPVPETRENGKPRRKAVLSTPEADLPPLWRRALADMRAARLVEARGLISLEERVPPSAKVIKCIASTLRVFAEVCTDNGQPVEISKKTFDLWRGVRFEAGNRYRSIGIRMKELLTFAVWIELDEDTIGHLVQQKRRYARAGAREEKQKDRWMLTHDLGIGDVWEKASELLDLASAAPAGSATRAWLTLESACLALSVVCPLRCGDLHRICFGTHLRRHETVWGLEIATAKTGLEYRRPELWPELTPFLDAVALLDTPGGTDIQTACARRSGTALFSRDGGRTGVADSWPSQCWRRHFGIGEHIVRTLWHDLMFESENDDQWIALALCGQGSGRTAVHYIVNGRKKRAARQGRAKLRALRQLALGNGR